MNIEELSQKWQNNREEYKTKEIGSGVQSFVKDILSSRDLFSLQEIVSSKNKKDNSFIHDTENGETGRPDFVLYIDKEIIMPVEVKRFGQIIEGVSQLQRYQLDIVKKYSKRYGILTDGWEWRFYRASTYKKYTLSEILEKKDEFLNFWKDYIKLENYYVEIFDSLKKETPFEDKLDLNISENRSVFFDDATKLIENFRMKLKTIGVLEEKTDKQELETAYAYLIQFILYKVLVDNGYKKFGDRYKEMFERIKNAIKHNYFYKIVIDDMKFISEYISENIYKPFADEQKSINKKLSEKLSQKLTLDDISVWLDIIIFIDKYNFANLKNEIFGFIYENYLKDLYDDKNKGQYFTDPEVVNLMLDEIGYTSQELAKDKGKMSIIDPSCGAGTFLYSAVDRIIETFAGKYTEKESQTVENLVSGNIFGLDTEEFSLYLAEMSILMRLLPLIVNDNYNNPIEEKIKVFKTNDSISEFLDAEIGAINPDIDYLKLFSKTDLGYRSFMRDNVNLQEMIESMQGHNGERMRFDYVLGNPPYIGYNESCKQQIPFTVKIKDKSDTSITMGNVYGVNLHTVPDRQKPYPPKPNLYAFFIALGLALLKKDGKMCYIVPQTMLTTNDLDVLRYHLAKFTTIETLITFEGNVFVGRGLKQNRPVATSSLIFVVSKKLPAENHKVKIINYKPYFTKKGESFKVYFEGKRRSKAKRILQSELLDNVANWNFIKFAPQKIKYQKIYNKNSLSIEDYRKNVLSDYNEIHLDIGYILDKNNFTKSQENTYPILDFKGATGYTKLIFNDFYPKNESKIQLTRNSRYSTLGHKYNIVNRIKNPQNFYFTNEPVIFNMGAASIIATDNKQAALFLFSLLNSYITKKILVEKLKLPNEQSYIVSLTAIKQYIRIPKITTENQTIKDKIIELTEKMLEMESVTLKDIVDFSELSIQRFENAQVSDNELVLNFNNKDYKCKIEKNKTEFVKKLIAEKFYDNGLIFNRQEVTLQELKNLPAIDFEAQAELKNHIDHLVFALYFEINLQKIGFEYASEIEKLCSTNEFYKIITDEISDDEEEDDNNCDYE